MSPGVLELQGLYRNIFLTIASIPEVKSRNEKPRTHSGRGFEFYGLAAKPRYIIIIRIADDDYSCVFLISSITFSDS